MQFKGNLGIHNPPYTGAAASALARSPRIAAIARTPSWARPQQCWRPPATPWGAAVASHVDNSRESPWVRLLTVQGMKSLALKMRAPRRRQRANDINSTFGREVRQ